MRDKYLLFSGGSECAASVKGPYTKVEAMAELEYFSRYYGGGPRATELLSETAARAILAKGDVDDLTRGSL